MCIIRRRRCLKRRIFHEYSQDTCDCHANPGYLVTHRGTAELFDTNRYRARRVERLDRVVNCADYRCVIRSFHLIHLGHAAPGWRLQKKV